MMCGDAITPPEIDIDVTENHPTTENDDHEIDGREAVAAPSFFKKIAVLHAQRWHRLPTIIDIIFRGAGQVIFLNSIFSGFLVIIALLYGNPWLGLLSFIGGLLSTITGMIVAPKYTQLEGTAMLREGLLSYNGVLVGCAFAVFLNEGHPNALSVIATFFGGVLSTLVSLLLKAIAITRYTKKMPSWTWGFNIVTLPVLLIAQLTHDVGTPEQETALLLNNNATYSMDAVHFLYSSCSGMSQIFVVNSVLSGVVFLFACFIFSPFLALIGVAGSTLGTLCAYLLKEDYSSLLTGIFGYNSALTALSVGVFFVPTGQALVLGVCGAIVTSLLTAGMNLVFASFLMNVPVLTIPFCIVASVCYYLGLSELIPGLRISKSPYSPERNVRFRTRQQAENGSRSSSGN
jgi:urea transporter